MDEMCNSKWTRKIHHQNHKKHFKIFGDFKKHKQFFFIKIILVSLTNFSAYIRPSDNILFVVLNANSKSILYISKTFFERSFKNKNDKKLPKNSFMMCANSNYIYNLIFCGAYF